MLPYQEHVGCGRFYKWIFGSVLALLAILFIYVMIVVVPFSTGEYGNATVAIFAVSVLILVASVVVFAAWNSRVLDVKVDWSGLIVRYGIFNSKQLKISEIVRSEAVQLPVGAYWGIGVRYGIDGSTAYITSFGEAVKVFLNDGRVFVFSSNHSANVIEALAEARASTQS